MYVLEEKNQWILLNYITLKKNCYTLVDSFIFMALSADGKSEVTVLVGFRKMIQSNIEVLKNGKCV